MVTQLWGHISRFLDRLHGTAFRTVLAARCPPTASKGMTAFPAPGHWALHTASAYTPLADSLGSVLRRQSSFRRSRSSGGTGRDLNAGSQTSGPEHLAERHPSLLGLCL